MTISKWIGAIPGIVILLGAYWYWQETQTDKNKPKEEREESKLRRPVLWKLRIVFAFILVIVFLARHGAFDSIVDSIRP